MSLLLSIRFTHLCQSAKVHNVSEAKIRNMNLRSVCRGRRILELGAGYGLAGLAVAACTEAREVVLTDGNPQVMDGEVYHKVFASNFLSLL